MTKYIIETLKPHSSGGRYWVETKECHNHTTAFLVGSRMAPTEHGVRIKTVSTTRISYFNIK